MLDDDSNDLTLCIIENNFLVNGAYLFKTSHFMGLVGLNVGSTFGNEFIFLGNGDQRWLEAKNSSYFRGTAIVGGSINLKHFFYQMEDPIGLGAKVVHNGKVNTFNTGNLLFAIGYKF